MASENAVIKVNIDGAITQPATALVEKIASAVGILYEPRRITALAKAEAQADKIKAIAKIEITEIEQRALRRLITEEAKKQENIEKITQVALNNLNADAKPERIHDDWVSYFFDRAKLTSDQEMQTLWAKILAGEASRAGTFCRRTLDAVALLEKEDAQLFTNLCAFGVINSETIYPIIYNYDAKIYKDAGFNFSSFIHLMDIGLIQFDTLSAFAVFNRPEFVEFNYFEEKYLLKPNANLENIAISNAIFSRTGLELFAICSAKKNDKFLSYLKDRYKSENIELIQLT